jgi:hypothetical protein
MSTSRITNVIEHLGFVRKGTNFKDDKIWDKYIEKFMMHYKEATPAMLRRAICSILTGKKEKGSCYGTSFSQHLPHNNKINIFTGKNKSLVPPSPRARTENCPSTRLAPCALRTMYR